MGTCLCGRLNWNGLGRNSTRFDYKNYKTGESQVNQALESGYAVIDNFKTESGVVMVMGFYSTSNNHDLRYGAMR